MDTRIKLLLTVVFVAALLGGGWRGHWVQIPAAGTTCVGSIWVPATPRRAGYWLFAKPGYCWEWVPEVTKK